jgi:PKD repeat protein
MLTPLAAASDIICGDVRYTIVNDGPSHFKYEWFVNGQLVSTSHNLNITFEHNTFYEIVLRGYFEDEVLVSSAKFSTPPGPFDTPLRLSYTKPTGCVTAGYYMIRVENSGASHYGTTYELWQDGKKVNANVFINGDLLSFGFTTDLQEHTTYEVKGYRTTSCGNYAVSQKITIEVEPRPRVNLAIETIGGIHCYEDREYAFIIKNSEIGFEYNVESQRQYYQGNGGDLVIPYDYYSSNPFAPGYRRELSVTARKIGCWKSYEMEQKAVIEVSPLKLTAEASATIISLNQPYQITNNSIADSYRWEVIDGDKKQVYTTAALPTLSFSTTGDKQIVLHGYSNTGCTASRTFHVKVTQPFSDQKTLDGCFDQSIVYKGPDDVQHNKIVLTSKTDRNGFLYQTGYVWSINPSGNYAYTLFVEKLDPTGKQVWHRRSPNTYFNYLRTFGSSLALDEEGNVYVAGSFGDGDLQIDKVLLKNHPFARRAIAGFVIKFNSFGKAEWGIVTQEQGQPTYLLSLVTDIAITRSGELYFTVFSEENSLAIFADHKEVSLTSEDGHNLVSLVKISKDGHYLASEPLMQAGTHSTTSVSYQNVEPVSGYWTYTPLGPKLAVDAANNILISGAVSISTYFGSEGHMTVGQTRLTPKAGTRHAGYVTRYSPATGWGKTFISYESPERITPVYSHYSMPARDRIISAPDGFYTLFNWSKDDAHDGDGRRAISIGDQVYASSNAGSCLSKYDHEGNLLWSNFSDATFISDLVLQPQSDGVLLYGTAENVSAFTSLAHQRNYGLTASNTRNHFLQATRANGDLAWIWQDHTATEKLEAQTIALAGNGGVYLTYKNTSISEATVSPETKLRYLPLEASCGPASVTVPFTRTQICLGGEAQLHVAGGTGSYTWEPATGLSDPAIANPMASPAATTLYRVKTQASTGEAVVREILVEVSTPFEQEPDFKVTIEDGLIDLEMLFDHPEYTFEWSFSNGQKDSRRKNIFNYYTEETSLTVCLKVKNGCEEKTVCKTIELPCRKNPWADILHDAFGEEHTFYIGYSSDVDSWKWVFSDGFESTERKVTRTFPLDGKQYSVELQVYSACSSNTVTRSFKALCPPLHADIKYSVSGRTVAFEAEGIPEEKIEYWNMRFLRIYEKKPVFTFPYNGTFTVYLSLNDGCSTQAMAVDVTINCQDPVAQFTYRSTDLSFQFIPYEVVDEAASLLWDFGDGNQSRERSPAHTYAAAGTYPVTLTVTNDCTSRSTIMHVQPKQLITGIIRDEANALLKIQPVPANDYLQIEFGKDFLNSVSQVIVYDAIGKDMLRINNPAEVKQVLDTRNFKTGAYHLKVVRRDGHYLIKRFVVQH